MGRYWLAYCVLKVRTTVARKVKSRFFYIVPHFIYIAIESIESKQWMYLFGSLYERLFASIFRSHTSMHRWLAALQRCASQKCPLMQVTLGIYQSKFLLSEWNIQEKNRKSSNFLSTIMHWIYCIWINPFEHDSSITIRISYNYYVIYKNHILLLSSTNLCIR